MLLTKLLGLLDTAALLEVILCQPLHSLFQKGEGCVWRGGGGGVVLTTNLVCQEQDHGISTVF